MLGLINAIVSSVGAVAGYVKEGLVMANRFLTPPKLSHPAQGSAAFDGASDYIQTNEPFSHTNHTISFWMYRHTTASGANYGVFDQRDGGGDGIVIADNTSRQIIYAINSTSRTSTAINSNEWVYVTASYDGSTIKLYLNGSLDQSASTTQTISTTTDAVIGYKSYSSSANIPFNGNLANVAIWNRALSSDEINAVMWKGYEALTSGEKNGLQAWYKLQESELFDVSDTSTTNLEKYAKLNSLTFEGKTCLQNALDGFPDITDARMHAGKYDIRVAQDGGNVESLSCVETELNALL